MSTRDRAALAAVGLLAVTMILVLLSCRRSDGSVNLLAGLPPNGVVAADRHGPQQAGPWVVTSGTLLTRDGNLWSGHPDAGPPAPEDGRTGSAVLRAVSARRDFADVHVHLRLRTASLSTTRRTPSHAWDGVHLFVRYRDQDHLYVVDLQRRDGTLTIKRKSPGYTTLAERASPPAARWRTYDVSAVDTPQGTVITLDVDGRPALRALDRDRAALRGPGRVGIRGDNADFAVGSFLVEPI